MNTMKSNILFALLLFFILPAAPSFAQSAAGALSTIQLYNASFEDMPRAGRQPRGWANCGWQGESPPDTQPDTTFRVSLRAKDGNSYLGMVTRDNDTYERVGQRLSTPIGANQCYSFSIYLARSPSYWSQSQATGTFVDYVHPSQLRIWGGAAQCDRRELLAESPLIDHTDWREYDFKFTPTQTHTYIILEVVYKMPTLFATNGNVIIDYASDIVQLPCSEEPNTARETPLLAESRPTPPTPKPPVANKPKPPVVSTPIASTPSNQPTTTTRPPVETPKPAAKKEKILADLDRQKIREGSIIQINKLYFEADPFALRENSFDVLDEIYEFLRDNPEVVVEIGGHTNNIPEHAFCDWLSEKRAKEVANYLMQKGIKTSRLQFKGYGKRKPIANNNTAVGRARNQRVEIKILSLQG